MTIINHDLRNVNGQYLTMPMYKGGQFGWGNLALPDPNFCDQTQQYPLGTRYVEGYCSYYYTFLQSATSGVTVPNATGYGVLAENVPFDVTVVTATGSTYEVLSTTAGVTANQFAGGRLAIYEVGASYVPRQSFYRIESNTATDDPATDQVKYTLSRKLLCTHSTSATCRVHQDPYSNVRFALTGRGGGHNYEACMGVWIAGTDAAGTAVAEGDYGWIQTWGPCFAVAMAYEGANSREREVYHYGAGAFTTRVATAEPGAQRVGFLMPATCANPGVSTSGGNVDMLENFVWLQIQP